MPGVSEKQFKDMGGVELCHPSCCPGKEAAFGDVQYPDAHHGRPTEIRRGWPSYGDGLTFAPTNKEAEVARGSRSLRSRNDYHARLA